VEERAERPTALRGKIGPHQLDLIVGQTDSLPTLAVVAARALELSRAATAPASEALAGLVSCDPALTARAMALANAACPEAVATARDAMARLSPDVVRSALLSARVLDGPSAPAGESGLDGAAFWRHSLAVAVAAERLAERLAPTLDADEAFTAGLLHDIGKLLLAWAVPKSYARVLAAARVDMRPLADHEREVLGVDHLLAGRRLARRWRLGETIENVLWLHHQPIEAMPASPARYGLVGIVSLADALARRERVGSAGSGPAGTSCDELADRLGAGREAVSAATDALDEAVERYARRLGLDEPVRGGGCWRDLSAANDELGRLNDRLARAREALAVQAEAFERFSAFSAGLGPRAELPDVLRGLAEAFGAAMGFRGEPTAAVVYSLDDDGTGAEAVRCSPGREPLWRAFPLNGAPGEDASLRDLLAEPDAWDDFLALGACSHQPLRCAGQWLGGVVVPAGARDDVCRALATVAGMAMGIVRQRCRAEALNEDLARASRRLAEGRDALIDAETVAAVEDIATGAAHELNNPLAVVSGRAQIMRDKARSQRQRTAWQTIADQAQRISEVIEALMEFARPAPPEPARIDPAELLTAAAEAFASSDHPQAATWKVDIEVGERLPQIRADRRQIQAAIRELIANAANAGPPGTAIRLAARSDEAGAVVLLTVADDGPGMDAETVARAFTPFFSAQKAGRRRGLGLPTARRYVENNGGRMWIDSRPGEGTIVTLRLPGMLENGGGKAEP